MNKIDIFKSGISELPEERTDQNQFTDASHNSLRSYSAKSPLSDEDEDTIAPSIVEDRSETSTLTIEPDKSSKSALFAGSDNAEGKHAVHDPGTEVLEDVDVSSKVLHGSSVTRMVEENKSKSDHDLDIDTPIQVVNHSIRIVKQILEDDILESVVQHSEIELDQKQVPENILPSLQETIECNDKVIVNHDIILSELDVSTGPLISDEEFEMASIDEKINYESYSITHSDVVHTKEAAQCRYVNYNTETTELNEISTLNQTDHRNYLDHETENDDKSCITHLSESKNVEPEKQLEDDKNDIGVIPPVRFNLSSPADERRVDNKLRPLLQRQIADTLSVEEGFTHGEQELSLDPTLTTTSDFGSLDPHLSAGEVLTGLHHNLKSEGELSCVTKSSCVQPISENSEMSSSESEASRRSLSSSAALLSSLSEGEWRASPQQLLRLANMAQSFRVIP